MTKSIQSRSSSCSPVPHAHTCGAETPHNAGRRRPASCASSLTKHHICGPSSIAAAPRGRTYAVPTASWPLRKRWLRPREAASPRALPIPMRSRQPLICSHTPKRRLTPCQRATGSSSAARCRPQGLPCAAKRRPHDPSPADNPCQDSGLWGRGRRASQGFLCTRCWGHGGLRLQPPPKAAAAPPWKSSGCVPNSLMCGSLVLQAHREHPPRRERPGSGNRLNGSPPASGLAPHRKGYAGAGAGIVRRSVLHICAVGTPSAMGSSCVRPQIGPEAIHRPASGPGASWRGYAGRSPSTQVSWSCGRGPLTQRGAPPSSSAPQRSSAVPRGVLAMAWAVNRASSGQQCASGNHSLTSTKGWHGDCWVMHTSQALSRPERVRSRRQRDG